MTRKPINQKSRLALIIAVLLAGCTGSGAEHVPFRDDAPVTLRFDAAEVAALGDSGLDDPCRCTTVECLRDWVGEHVGCDICVVLVCGQDDVHACAYCPPDLAIERKVVPLAVGVR